jgi:hypothetical protein
LAAAIAPAVQFTVYFTVAAAVVVPTTVAGSSFVAWCFTGVQVVLGGFRWWTHTAGAIRLACRRRRHLCDLLALRASARQATTIQIHTLSLTLHLPQAKFRPTPGRRQLPAWLQFRVASG